MPGALLPSRVNRPIIRETSDGPPPGFLETLGASFEAARADTTGQVEGAQLDAYKPIMEELAKLGYPAHAFVNPAKGTVATVDLWAAVEKERAQGRFKSLPATRDQFEQQWRAKERQRIEKAEQTAARGNGVTAFVGGVAGAMTDPINLYTLPVGGIGRTIGQKVATEALANAAIEAVMQPVVAGNRQALGRRELTIGEAAENIAFAAVGAAALRGGFEVGAKHWDSIAAAPRATQEKVWGAILDKVPALREKVGARIDWQALDPHLPDIAEAMVPADQLTDFQRGAIAAMRREQAVDAGNPFIPDGAGTEAHYTLLAETMRGIMDGAPAFVPRTSPTPAARLRGGTAIATRVTGDAMQTVKARIGVVESGGRANAKNPRSSAMGLYQFTDSTWLAYYKRRYGAGGLSDSQIIAKKGDTGLQNTLMDDLLADNATALERAGHAADAGNLYLAHFAGHGGAVKVLGADPGAPVSVVLGQKVINANPFLRGMTASDLIAWAHRKMGGPAPAARPRSAGDAPVRDVTGEQDILTALDRELADTEAQLAQLDSPVGNGARDIGDAVDSLADDLQAVPVADAVPLPRPDAVDTPPVGGVAPQGPRVLGLTPEAQAVIPALRDIVETQRGVSLNKPGPLAAMLEVDEANLKAALQQMAIDGLILQSSKGTFSRLPRAKGGPEDIFTFIARTGGVSPEGFSQAQIARNATMDNPPRGHDLGTIFQVERLVEWRRRPDANGQGGERLDTPYRTTRPALIPGVGPIVRKGGRGLDEIGEDLVSAGFFRERPDENQLLELLQEAWGSGRKVYSLNDMADVEARQLAMQEVSDPANPFMSRFQSDEHYLYEFGQFDTVARDRFGFALDDEAFADAYSLFQDGGFDDMGEAILTAIQREIEDLQARELAERGMDDAGDIIEEWEAALREDSGAGLEEIPAGRFDPADPGPDAEAGAYLVREDTGPIDPDSWRAWDDPDGAAAKATADSMEHDARAILGALDRGAEADPAIAARQRQEAQLRADAPLRGENATGQAQDGTMGSPLFDAVDQPFFRLDEEGDVINPADLLAEFDDDAAFIKTVRDCL